MSKILIIAEAGVNHNGSLDLAYKMVDKAKEAGADIVKFQTSIPEKVVTRYAEKAAYQKVTTGNSDSQLDMIKKIVLKFDDFVLLKDYCESKCIKFLSTPFDLDSIEFLSTLKCGMWKIPSGEVTNMPHLEKIASFHEPVILSTGMSNLQEVSSAIDILKSGGAGQITLLHCTTEYPAPVTDVNLNAMLTMKKAFGLPVGYSDHTPGIEISLAAASLGATVIEKHFTLDRNMAGPDHKASLEPEELKALVKGVRNIEMAMGDGLKSPCPSEMKNISIVRRSIVAACQIKKGEIFTEGNLVCKRPGTGISPMEWNSVLGKRAKRDFAEDEFIEL